MVSSNTANANSGTTPTRRAVNAKRFRGSTGRSADSMMPHGKPVGGGFESDESQSDSDEEEEEEDDDDDDEDEDISSAHVNAAAPHSRAASAVGLSSAVNSSSVPVNIPDTNGVVSTTASKPNPLKRKASSSQLSAPGASEVSGPTAGGAALASHASTAAFSAANSGTVPAPASVKRARAAEGSSAAGSPAVAQAVKSSSTKSDAAGMPASASMDPVPDISARALRKKDRNRKRKARHAKKRKLDKAGVLAVPAAAAPVTAAAAAGTVVAAALHGVRTYLRLDSG